MPGRSVTRASTPSTAACGTAILATSAPWTAPATVMVSGSTPRARAKRVRLARAAVGSGACFRPTEPNSRVEKPCTSPSPASCGTVRTSGTCSFGSTRAEFIAANSTRGSKRAESGGLAAPGAEDLLDLPLDLLQVHELAVDRREPDVCD